MIHTTRYHGIPTVKSVKMTYLILDKVKELNGRGSFYLGQSWGYTRCCIAAVLKTDFDRS